MASNSSGRHPKATGPLSIDALTTAIGSKHSTEAEDGQSLPAVIATIPTGDGEVRVTLGEFKGAPTIDLRLYQPFTMARAPMPTAKGITLGLGKLPELAKALSDATAAAEAMGLLDGSR